METKLANPSNHLHEYSACIHMYVFLYVMYVIEGSVCKT